MGAAIGSGEWGGAVSDTVAVGKTKWVMRYVERREMENGRGRGEAGLRCETWDFGGGGWGAADYVGLCEWAWGGVG